MIKYLDKIKFPESYIISDSAKRRYDSIDDWIRKTKYRIHNKHYIKKYKNHESYIRIINTSKHKEDVNDYLVYGNDITDNAVNIVMSNSTEILLHISRDLSSIELIQLIHNDSTFYEESFIDPKVYYDGLRLDESSSYFSSYCSHLSHSTVPYNIRLSDDIKSGKFFNYHIAFGYIVSDYRFNHMNSGDVLCMRDVFNANLYCIVPYDHLIKNNKKRDENNYNRYRITTKDSSGYSEIFHVDSISKECAINALKESIEDDDIIIENIVKLTQEEWF